MPSICFSVVSHLQGRLVSQLLDDLNTIDLSKFEYVEIKLTLNLPENEDYISTINRPCSIIRNPAPIGFGANHNQAFASSSSDYFVVLNPDVRLNKIDIFNLINSLPKGWGCCAPAVVSPTGSLEDSARKFPTSGRIARRLIKKKCELDYTGSDKEHINVDWLAGIFLLFPRAIYIEIKGFDDKYFMYLEDADICRRLHRAGYKVIYDTSQTIIHDARRSTLKNLTHFKWHVRSMLRFLYGL